MQLTQSTPPVPPAREAARAFVMVNATACEPSADLLRHEGYYCPESQTWVGRIEIGAGTYSSRSTGRNGDYGYQSDD